MGRIAAAGRIATMPAVAVVLVLTAGFLASMALFALAAGLGSAMLVSAGMLLLARRRVSVTRSVTDREVCEDEPLRLGFTVRGLGRLPVRLLTLDPDERWVPLEDVVEVEILRRGAYRLDPTELRLSDALGIFRWKVHAGPPESVLVLPVPDTGVRVPLRLGPRTDELEPDGLRPYVPGTPLSRVHWPSLARGAGLHELRVSPPPAGLPLVVVDTAGADTPAALDWLARAAAGQVLRLVGAGGCEVLLPGDTAATPVQDQRQWRAMHRRLALMEPGPRGTAALAGATVVRVPAGLDLSDTELPLPTWVVPAPPEALAAA